MEITIKAKDYLEELKLMDNQWGQETDLYPWIYMLLQMGEVAPVSIRDIHLCQKSRSPLFFGLAGAPDFVILDKNVILQEYSYENKKYDIEKHKEIKNITCLRGCVEIKKLHEKLCDIETLIYMLNPKKNKKNLNKTDVCNIKDGYQIIGHLLWYGKVLYTNGLQWQLLEWKNRGDYLKYDNLTEEKIKILQNNLDKINKDNPWYNVIDIKDKIIDVTHNDEFNNEPNKEEPINISITKICNLGNYDDIRNNKIPENFKQEWAKLIKFLKENDFWYQ